MTNRMQNRINIVVFPLSGGPTTTHRRVFVDEDDKVATDASIRSGSIGVANAVGANARRARGGVDSIPKIKIPVRLRVTLCALAETIKSMPPLDTPRVVTVVVSAGDASTTTTDATPIDLAARDGVERAVIANKDVAMSRLNALFGTAAVPVDDDDDDDDGEEEEGE